MVSGFFTTSFAVLAAATLCFASMSEMSSAGSNNLVNPYRSSSSSGSGSGKSALSSGWWVWVVGFALGICALVVSWVGYVSWPVFRARLVTRPAFCSVSP
eukprot:m51a1_g3015 hypothetical protein (100) ;mRNA; f:856270-856632